MIVEFTKKEYKFAKNYDSDAAFDLCACIDEPIGIQPQEIKIIDTGIKIELDNELMYALILPRSGLACKYGITVINSPGLIDYEYRGEIKVGLINHSNEPFIVNDGDRIAQLLICQNNYVNTIFGKVNENTKRGNKGFGSSGL